MIESITQSFIKDMISYQAGGICGNMVRERWVNDRLFGGSAEMALGAYFEYYLTFLLTGKGSLPKDGKMPQRGMYKDGSKPLAEYARAEANAKRVIVFIKEMGLEVVEAGVNKKQDEYSGTIDLICRCTKKIIFANSSTWNIDDLVVIDLKYSGLLDNKWEKMGWAGMLLPGPHIQKEYHKIQSTQYHYLTGLPFYYLVVSSKNETDSLFLHVPVTPEMVSAHLEVGKNSMEYFKFVADIGFEPRPSISDCSSCPLKSECPDKHTFPHPVTIDL